MRGKALLGTSVPLGPLSSTHPCQRHSAPVIDVSPRVDVPALDGGPHALLYLLPLGLADAPRLRPIEHDVGEDAAGVVRNFDPISLALQQVAAKGRENSLQVPLQTPAAGPQLTNWMPEVLLTYRLLSVPSDYSKDLRLPKTQLQEDHLWRLEGNHL